MILRDDQYLEHYGTPRHSGRYPWGSGNHSQRNKSFLDRVAELKSKGVSESEIAKGMGITTTQLRARKSIAINQQKQEKINQVQRLRDKGWGYSAIGRHMGMNESSVRALLAPGEKDKVDVLRSTSEMLKKEVEQKGYIDFSSGVENHLGISQTKLATAVALLKEEGYKVHYVKQPQLGTGELTTTKVLGAPESKYPRLDQVKSIASFSDDGGRSFLGIHDPLSINSKRIAVNYAKDGGAAQDGVIFVRPGVKDLNMGKSHYAQVRIKVDDTHYMKGMAIYKDGLPPGKDLVFNTNKDDTGHHLDAFKELKKDPDNPFGAVVRQIVEKGPDGKERVTSAMNIVNEEGDWHNWSKSLASQMLSKQDPKFAQRQLDLTYEARVNELSRIQKLTHPAVKKKLLESYADAADSSAVDLKAAALPRQASHVILPVPTMKEHEVFAPNYNTGERVALVRYPHGGTFEIPQLTVNNRNPDARRLITPGAKDAIGIHPSVAHRLSGADFDGDAVLVIPNDKQLVKSTPALEGLKHFDPRHEFPPYDGMRTIDGGVYHAATRSVDYGKTADGEPRKPNTSTKQHEMGNITNLIADMTIRGANTEELARAVRHSMVVIDSEKHSLDYKSSAAQNGIGKLKARYQGIPSGSKFPTRAGASTLITRASSDYRPDHRKPRKAQDGGPVDKATGKKMWEYTGETYVDKRTGKTVKRTVPSKRLAETDDAHTLSSGTRIENIYADHSNRLKALANKARKEAVNTNSIPYNASAKATYADQVKSLDEKLNEVIRKRPLERQAQRLAAAVVSAKVQANPNMDQETKKKIRSQALTEMRIRTGVIKPRQDGEKTPSGIVITPEEWRAIQAGAISNHKLEQILDKADLDVVKQLATPREERKLTETKKARARSMFADGYTMGEIASQLGVSRSTISKALADDG